MINNTKITNEQIVSNSLISENLKDKTSIPEQLEATEKYWTLRADGYSQSINESLEKGETEKWISKISQHIDITKKLKILDIGTGPGFFPIILGKLGHDITAIDCTEAMLETANENCSKYNINVNFICMDAQKLEFPDNSFDLVICRNLVWNLEHPKKAYVEWLRVLVDGGKILIFDGNHYLQLFDQKYADTIKKTKSKNDHRYIGNVDTNIMLEIAKKLPLSRERRPQWDVITFVEIGSRNIEVDLEHDDLIYFKEDMEIKNIPLNFTVCVTK